MAPDDVLDEVRKNFRTLIKDEVSRFTQKEVADMMGVSQTNVSSWCIREDILPTIANLWAVARYKGKTLWELTKELSGASIVESRPDFLTRMEKSIDTLSDRELSRISRKMMERISERLIR